MSFFGKGWHFPPVFDPNEGAMSIVGDETDIQQSLKILFTTIPGERIGHPLFGCDLKKFMFRGINASLLAEMRQTIFQAVTLFETRVKVIEVTTSIASKRPNSIDINILLQHNHTNSRYNMILPFNVHEGVVLE